MNSKINLDQFSLIVDLISKVCKFIHYHLAKDFIKEFISTSFNYLISLGTSEIRTLKREKIDSLISKIKEICFKVYIDSDINVILDEFIIDFGAAFLESEILDKKLIGLKLLSSNLTEVIRNNENDMHISNSNKHSPTKNIIQRLKEKKIFNLIFGSNSHAQIIQKSSDLVRSMLIGNGISLENLEQLIDLSRSIDSDTRNAAKSIIKNNSYVLSYDYKLSLVKSIFSDMNKVTVNDIEMIELILRGMGSYDKDKLSQYLNSHLLTFVMETQNNALIEEIINLIRSSDMYEYRIDFCVELLLSLSNVIIANIGYSSIQNMQVHQTSLS